MDHRYKQETHNDKTPKREDNIEEILDDFGFVNDFLEIMPKTKSM